MEHAESNNRNACTIYFVLWRLFMTSRMHYSCTVRCLSCDKNKKEKKVNKKKVSGAAYEAQRAGDETKADLRFIYLLERKMFE